MESVYVFCFICFHSLLEDICSFFLGRTNIYWTPNVLKFTGNWGFPGGAVVKSPPANAGDTGSSPGPGISHMPQSN